MAAGLLYLSRVDLMLNPVVRYVQNHEANHGRGERVPLVPVVFKYSAEKEIVTAKLVKHGFESIENNDDLTVRLNSNYWSDGTMKIESDLQVYVRETNNFVCGQAMYVLLRFDSREELAFAEAAEFISYCL